MYLQLENNTPEVYSEESRDFQLLCRILNIFLNASIEKSSKLPYDTSIDTLDDGLLYLMARRLGFTTHKYFPTKILKNICENYPDLIGNKGTKKAIEKAAYTVLSANHDIVFLEVKVNNNIDVSIASNANADEKDYLAELLSFIVPAGVAWRYIPSVTKEITYNSTQKSFASLSRLRGIGASVSRIIGNKNTQLPDDDLNSKFNEQPSSVTKFYSKVNVAKITTKKYDDDNGSVAFQKYKEGEW